MNNWILWQHDTSKFITTIDQDVGLDIIFDTDTTDYFISLPGYKAHEDKYVDVGQIRNILSSDQAELSRLNKILTKDSHGVLRYDSDNILRNRYEAEAKKLDTEIKYCKQALDFIEQEESAFRQRQWDAKKLSAESIDKIHKILADCNIKISDEWNDKDTSYDIPLYVILPACEGNEFLTKVQMLINKLEIELPNVDMNTQDDNLLLFYKEGI